MFVTRCGKKKIRSLSMHLAYLEPKVEAYQSNKEIAFTVPRHDFIER
jgi:hypothetical protein